MKVELIDDFFLQVFILGDLAELRELARDALLGVLQLVRFASFLDLVRGHFLRAFFLFFALLFREVLSGACLFFFVPFFFLSYFRLRNFSPSWTTTKVFLFLFDDIALEAFFLKEEEEEEDVSEEEEVTFSPSSSISSSSPASFFGC